MRLFLSLAAVVLLGAMLLEPLIAQKGGVLMGSSDLSLLALGLAGVVLGQRGGRKAALPEDSIA